MTKLKNANRQVGVYSEFQSKDSKHHHCMKVTCDIDPWSAFIAGQSNTRSLTCIYVLSDIPYPQSVKHDYQLSNILILIYYHSYDNNRLGTFRIVFRSSLRFYYQVVLDDIRKNNYSWRFYLYKTYNILRKYDMKCLFINW